MLGSPAQIPVARGDQQGILILFAPTTAQWSVRIEAYSAATKGKCGTTSPYIRS